MLPKAFSFEDQTLCCERVPLPRLAEQFSTPLYIYSERALTEAYAAFKQACGDHPVQICFAVKANPNLAILQTFAQLGAGFDIVSGGELARAALAGAHAEDIVFSGVGKTQAELAQAVQAGVGCINVESEAELYRLSEVCCALGRAQPISLRVNPDIDPKTHPYISTGLKDNKFGVAIEDARRLYSIAARLPGLSVMGVDCHIGSQITSLSPFVEAVDRILSLVDQLADAGLAIEHIDLGGGLGICYHDEAPPSPEAFMQAVLNPISAWAQRRNRSMPKILFELGRALVGSAGVLLTRVEMLKPSSQGRQFAIVDAAMNDLMRPSLYQAWHEVIPVRTRAPEGAQVWDLVGPICESGDWLAKDRLLALEAEDLLVLASAGAYGSSMGSQYNSRPRPAEVLVRSDGSIRVIRERETLQHLIESERGLHGEHFQLEGSIADAFEERATPARRD
ncbi:MAG: diaminopimelate decarboxylase [Pseudomonadota bacterium]|jgi:diaminopimelate decarboxylase